MDSTIDPKIVTLCGSSKFEKEFQKITEILTLRNYLVISLGIFSKSMSKEKQVIITQRYKHNLELIHKKKIDICDIAFIMNVDRYIGESTKQELEYAISKGKKIMFYTDFDIICKSCGQEWCECHFS